MENWVFCGNGGVVVVGRGNYNVNSYSCMLSHGKAFLSAPVHSGCLHTGHLPSLLSLPSLGLSSSFANVGIHAFVVHGRDSSEIVRLSPLPHSWHGSLWPCGQQDLIGGPRPSRPLASVLQNVSSSRTELLFSSCMTAPRRVTGHAEHQKPAVTPSKCFMLLTMPLAFVAEWESHCK